MFLTLMSEMSSSEIAEELGLSIEEVDRLAVREIIGGYWRSVGTTFAGGTTLAENVNL